MRRWSALTAIFLVLAGCGSSAGVVTPDNESSTGAVEAASASDPAAETDEPDSPGSESDSALITISGAENFAGGAELLCTYWEDLGEFLATFSSLETNDVDTPVAVIFTRGEFENELGGGLVGSLQFTPASEPVLVGLPQEGAVKYTGAGVGLVFVEGDASIGGATVEFEGWCRPTPGQ